MPARVKAVRPGESSDPEINELLEAGRDSWWGDAAMFGVIGRRPDLLKTIVPVFVAFFGKGIVEPHIHELMRIKTGQVNDCTY